MAVVSGADLRAVPIFAGLAPDLLERLERAAFSRRLARRQVLFAEGEPSDHLYLVQRGALKVHLTSDQGTELLLAMLGPGHSLGEASLIDDGARSATVTALSDSALVAVPAQAVRALLREHPDALWAVAESLSTSLRRLTRQTADLVFLDLPRRLAKLLLDSARPGADGVPVVTLAVTQSDLAAMLGVTRQSLNKALSGFTARGWLEPDDHTIRLPDPDALRRFIRT